ncbi:hypothetical protein GGH96_003979 [Coemansia sp. RSA 1972]|nr:hypothetical protein GGH96_003979 [Coemansia sp. RSA 1972]
MADFGMDWSDGEQADDIEEGATTIAGVVVHRVAASDRQANPHGTTESELLEPMMQDKAKELEVQTLESEEQNLSALETFCQRSTSEFIFQRVWAAKEAGRQLPREAREIGLGVLVPLAMQLAEDRELFVRETMAQELLPVLQYYFENKQHAAEINTAAADSDTSRRSSGLSTSSSDSLSPTEAEEPEIIEPSDETQVPKLPPKDKRARRNVVPPVRAPTDDEFGAWLHRVLLTAHPSVSLPAQRATVALGRELEFETFHTEIVHGVVLGLVRNPVHEQMLSREKRSKEMVVKTRASGSPPRPVSRDESARSSTSSMLGSGLASLFGRRSWQSEPAVSNDELDLDAVLGEDAATGAAPAGFFVSPADEVARLEQTRRKLLMLHMIHLVAAEFGADMRPAVFVPVVERSAKDRTFEVRRDAAAVLGSLAKAVSNDLAVDVLFQSFLQLTQDVVWQVRQSAARHALPGLALVLAARSNRPLSASPHVADHERKHSLQHFAGSAASGGSSLSSNSNGDIGAELGARGGSASDTLNAFMYRNQPARSIPDRQWLQLVDRLASTREPSLHVRAAVFESVGKLALALVDCPRTRDALVSLVVGDVQRANNDGGAGRFGRFGSSSSLQSLDEDEDELDEAAAAEDAALRLRALADVPGAPPAASQASAGRAPGRARAPRAVGRDVLYHSAFNFPALLASLGAQGWDRLRDAYMQLSKSEHYDARQTLACSLHEVARILASNNAYTLASSTRLASNRVSAGGAQSTNPMSSYSADLESVLCLFLIDGAEIKMGALGHLGDTLTWLTPASRVRCLPMIMQVFKHDGAQWRTRELMATQLVKLCHLFPASLVVSSLLPQAVEWAHDPVAGVRAAVAPAFPIVFELTKLDPTTQVRFFETVISFSHAASFRGRLFFVEICAALLAHDQDPNADPVDFDQFFLPSLAALAGDRVANVRIALARLVRRMLENRMRRQSISATLADMWVPPSTDASGAESEWVDQGSSSSSVQSSNAKRMSIASSHDSAKRVSSTSRRRSSSARRMSRNRSSTHESVASMDVDKVRQFAHRSLGSITRRPRRNTTPMRAHLLATMVQQLAKDTDRDVLDLVRDLPGLPLTVVVVTDDVTADDVADIPAEQAQTCDRADEKESEKVSSLLKEFPHPPPSPPLVAQVVESHGDEQSAQKSVEKLTDSDVEQSPVDEQMSSDNELDPLDELLSSYERDDNSPGISAIGLPFAPSL